MRRQAASREAGFTYLWTLFAVALMGVGMMLGAELWATTVKREREPAIRRSRISAQPAP